MKTLAQINKKIEKLKARLNNKPVVENFGDKEYQNLADFIGNIYDYPYETRLKIQSLKGQFFTWCINYTGNN